MHHLNCRRGARGFNLPGVVFCALTLALTQGTHAQEKPKDASSGQQQLQEVVVTGSRIARPDLDRLQPTTVVGSDTFDTRGYTDIAQALQDLPAFGVHPPARRTSKAARAV